MINIFTYTDFRKYLTDFYEDRKKSESRFSYRYLSEQSGINPGNFIKMLKGERNLTLVAAIKLSQPMGLNKRERDYFQSMIRFSQAKKHDEKKRCFEELITFKESSVRVLDAGYYMFYDKWYYTAVREALSFFPLNDKNFAELGKAIIPGISVKQVEKTVKLLLELKLIVKEDSGYYQRTDSVLSTGNEMRSLVLNNFVINTMKLAAQAINARVQETNLSTVTCSLSSEGFNQVQEEIRKCRRRILEIAKDNNLPDRVYQFNMQLFPLTERYEGGQL